MRIRPARFEADSARILALINAVEPEPFTLIQLQSWFEHNPPGRITRRMVATNDQDEVIGYSEVIHETWSPPRHFYVWLVVDGQHRRQGLGSALYADAEAYLHDQDAASQASEVRDNFPAGLRFAQQRGFTIDRHRFESTLDLAKFDETPYVIEIERLESEGIRFFTLADFQDSSEARRKLYEVNYVTALDIPGAEVFMPFSEFEKVIFGAEWYRPEGQLIAVDGDKFVGLSAVRLIPKTQGAYNLVTGVIKPYRGRKIAQALKVLAIRYARLHGAGYLRTNNDSLNAPMLAVNQKLGYLPQPGIYILRR